MSAHPINELMTNVMSNLKQMVDVNTIVGSPVETADGTTIIPVSKVGFGFATGGSDFSAANPTADSHFGGGSGAGVTINPVAFLYVSKGNVKLIPIEKYDGAVDRVVGMVPDLVDKVTELFKKDKNDDLDTSDLDKDIDEFV